MNLTYVFEHGDPVLIATFVLLIVMSVLSWFVILWKAGVFFIENWRLQGFEKRNRNIGQLFDTGLDMDKTRGALYVLTQEVYNLRPHVSGLQKEHRETVLTTHLMHKLDAVRTNMEKGLTLLASIASSAPFIGLFGTVWGIYGALLDISEKGNASLAIVAGPMGEALVATAVGLFAAIPAVLAYNMFIRKNKVLMQRMKHICEKIVLHYSIATPQKR